MLATFVEESFDRAGWLFELKLDGYRAIAEVEPKSALLYSRNHNSYEERFRPVVESLRRLGHRAVLDGEVVVVDAAGKPQFQLLQNYQKTGRGRLVYYVFDLLYLDGHDLRGLPLKRRKEILQQVLPDLPAVKFNEHVEERGTAFFQAVAEHGLEGVIAKNAASPYREGLRSRNWLKIKTHLRQQAVIAGYTKPRGSRKNLGALVLGVYDGEALVYIGHAGGGFAETTLADVYAKLRPLAQDKCPFVKRPKTNAPVQWVRPELVCEVTFQAWTQDGQMRQPIFLGLRQDEPARSVRRERPAATAEILSGREDKAKEGTRKMVSVEGHAAVNQHRPPFGDKAVPLTHLDKVYWPQERYTKGDLIAYYRDIGSFIFPYLKDRPQSLHRHPNGIEGNSFFQKDMSRQRHPDWVKTVRLSSESKGEEITYFVCTDERSLLYLANLGCIELNPWHSRIGTLDRPDYLVIDLDPENVPFDRLVKTAQAVRKLLDQIEAEGYCKTSGKRGLHIYVPLAGRYDYDLARRFAEVIANLVHRQFPEFTSIIRSPALRQQRVYLDYLQNGRGKTLAAPYSVRPVRNATVSTPLKWSEVRKGLDPAKFTILSMRKRLDKIGDVWEPVLGPGVDLEKCLERISRMFKEQRR
jgi:bifunctional non-homologous end joining protein LigD